MSEKYRLMIYFAVATFYLYRASIQQVRGISHNRFRELNREVIKRIFDEGKALFGYELSNEQIDRAIAAYLADGQDVAATTVATPP